MAAIANLLLVSWAFLSLVLGQPSLWYRPGKTPSLPQSAWEAFNTYLKTTLNREALDAFQDINHPEKPDFNEHTLNQLAADRTQERILNILKDTYTVDTSILVWDTDLPAGYNDAVTRNVGVAEYTSCSYPPEVVFDVMGDIIKQPCREGGSVFVNARSTILQTATREERSREPSTSTRGRQERLPANRKRFMLFYTPHDAYSLVSHPDYEGATGPTHGTLMEAFNRAMSNCAGRLQASVTNRISVSGYADCISSDFILHPMEYQTALRGVAVVPEVLAETAGYSAPGRCIPFGNAFAVAVDIEAYVKTFLKLGGEMKLWIFANGPVMVLED